MRKVQEIAVHTVPLKVLKYVICLFLLTQDGNPNQEDDEWSGCVPRS